MRLHKVFAVVVAVFVIIALAASADAQQKRRFTFGYDQPKSTGYGYSGDVFGKKLEELSKGAFVVDQFPAAQLGQEPVMLQKTRSGDIDFMISSTANGATVSPQLGVMSIHYLFENDQHLIKAIASPELNAAVRQLVRETVQGAHVITLQTLGLRNLYGKREIKKVEDLKGAKVRVQATKTEDTCFPAYGAQTVHMPFGEVYTSLQPGVVEFAENGVNVYLAGKHYEVAPIMSMTEHEANNSLVWVSEKTWNSFTDEQKKWVETAANEVAKQEPPYAIRLEKESGDKLQKMSIKIKDKEGLFVISFQDHNPRIARDYVNALVRRYIDENTSSKREESYGATKFISEQLSVFKEKLEKSEEAANSFKRGPGAIASMDPSLLLKDINDSQQRLDDLRIKKTQLETTLAGLSKATSVQSNLPAMQKRLQELQLQYTDSYPEIIRLKDDIRNLEAQVTSGQGVRKPLDSPEYARLASELKAIRQAEANLSSNIARNRGLLQNIPAARSKLEDLEREKSSQKSLYEIMAARQGQSEVSKQMEVQDKTTTFRVVDPAITPIKPVGPKRVKIILLGILGGIVASFGLILLVDYLDKSVKELESLKSLGVPILAVIPRIESENSLLASRRKDIRFFSITATYFLLILGTLSFEALRDYSDQGQVKSHLSQLKGMFQKF